MVTKKDLDDFFTIEVVMEAVKSTPFEFERMISMIAVKYGSEGIEEQDEVVRLFYNFWQNNAELHLRRYFESVLRRGFIKRISYNNQELFELTEKGERLQDVGSLEKYYRAEKRKKRKELRREIVSDFVTPLIALLAVVSNLFPYLKKDKPVEIKQPLILHIDNFQKAEDSTKTRLKQWFDTATRKS